MKEPIKLPFLKVILEIKAELFCLFVIIIKLESKHKIINFVWLLRGSSTMFEIKLVLFCNPRVSPRELEGWKEFKVVTRTCRQGRDLNMGVTNRSKLFASFPFIQFSTLNKNSEL